LAGFWGPAFIFDSRIFRSLLLLLCKPGKLTVEYLRGRRVRYVPPLRLYVSISIAFFLLLSVWINTRVGRGEAPSAALPDSAAVAQVIAGLRALPDSADVRVPATAQAMLQERLRATGAADDTISGGGPQMVVMGKEVTSSPSKVIKGIMRLAPKAVFLLLPLFAGLLALVYRRSKRFFIEHLVFSLHYHAVVFLGFTVGMIVQRAWLWGLLIVIYQVHLLLAMRRVYAQGWLKTVIKHFLLTSAYNLVLIIILGSTATFTAYLVTLSKHHPWIRGWLGG
jgi:hypothetical protein